MPSEPILLIYDSQCPACDYYARLVRIRASIGPLTLIDARADTGILRDITAQGLDMDQGMVLKLGDQLYYGAEAMHALALISSRSGCFNRLNYWLFKSRTLSRLGYPVLRRLRNLLLKILGKRKINNLNIQGNDKF